MIPISKQRKEIINTESSSSKRWYVIRRLSLDLWRTCSEKLQMILSTPNTDLMQWHRYCVVNPQYLSSGALRIPKLNQYYAKPSPETFPLIAVPLYIALNTYNFGVILSQFHQDPHQGSLKTLQCNVIANSTRTINVLQLLLTCHYLSTAQEIQVSVRIVSI